MMQGGTGQGGAGRGSTGRDESRASPIVGFNCSRFSIQMKAYWASSLLNVFDGICEGEYINIYF